MPAPLPQLAYTLRQLPAPLSFKSTRPGSFLQCPRLALQQKATMSTAAFILGQELLHVFEQIGRRVGEIVERTHHLLAADRADVDLEPRRVLEIERILV